MTQCLLCTEFLQPSLSWLSLLGFTQAPLICDACRSEFEAVQQQPTDTIFQSIHCLYEYNEAMQQYIHQYKFLQDIALAGVFQVQLRKALRNTLYIVPIPMHPERKVARTFAHVDALLDAANIPFEQVLTKRSPQVMSKKTRQQRFDSEPLFALEKDAVIRPVTYTLVDDIYTTGTTLRHAASTLKQAGAKSVRAVTLVRA